MKKPPLLEPRGERALFQELLRLAPFYVPEWRPDHDQAGRALGRVAAAFLSILAKKLNAAPQNNQLAYLHMLGERPRSAARARAPLQFLLSEGARRAVAIPAGTRLFSQSAKQVVFETVRDFDALPQSPAFVFQTLLDGQCIAANWETPKRGGKLRQRNLAHDLYLGIDGLPAANPNGFCHLEIRGTHTAVLDPEKGAQWQVFTSDEKRWQPLSGVCFDGRIISFQRPRQMGLHTIEGSHRHWLRVCLPKSLPQLRINAIQLSCAMAETVIPLKAMTDLAGNPLQSQSGPLLPLGSQIQPFSGCHLCFGKPRAGSGTITLRLTLARAGVLPPGVLSNWFYFNGLTWTPLPLAKDTTNGWQRNGTLAFSQPPDWQPFSLGGRRDHWLRLRLAFANVSEVATAQAPQLERIEMLVDHSGSNRVVVLANGQGYFYRQPALAANWQPFPMLAQQAFYLGYQERPSGVKTSLFFHLEQNGEDAGEAVWEAASNVGDWQSLGVCDDTASLTRSGPLELVFPNNWEKTTQFGRTAYWLRARFPAAQKGTGIPIKALYPNTVWAVQGHGIRAEQPEPVGNDQPGLFRLRHVPAMEVRVWVNEWDLQDGPAEPGNKDLQVRETRNEHGEITARWVLWHQAAFLKTHGAEDRVYLLDPIGGRLQFGDGKHGRKPKGGATAISVDYQHCDGHLGNLPPGSLSGLASSLPYVVGVHNPLAAEGGAAGETQTQVAGRAPGPLAHRHRAVTESDFQRLAVQAHAGVARAWCFRQKGTRAPLTVVLMTFADHPQPQPDAALCRTVVLDLRQRCSPATAAALVVRGPDYCPVSIEAKLWVREMQTAAETAAAAKQTLTAWLHPRTGAGGQGWSPGRFPTALEVATLLQGLTGISDVHVTQVALAEKRCSRSLCCAGSHRLVLETGSEPWA